MRKVLTSLADGDGVQYYFIYYATNAAHKIYTPTTTKSN